MIQAITYMTYCSKNWPKETIPPNLHVLENHAADFIVTWPLPGHVVYGEQSAESIHKIFRLLQRAYCSMQPATIRLQSMVKKNIIARLVHKDAKALKPVILKRE